MVKAATSLPLPDIDSRILQQAFATAAACDREPNPDIRKVLEERALNLWAAAHEARRAAMYGRPRR
jgi:hypothetical protein